MKKIETALFAFYNMILYLLSILVPKKDNLWLFGSWDGQRYADNSKYLFEYIEKNHKDTKVCWITRNKGVFEHLKKNGHNVCMAYTLMAIAYSLRAKVLFVTQNIGTDLHPFNNNKKILKVQLWHGAPLKKILHDSPFAKNNARLKRKGKLSTRLLPYLDETYDCITACSEEDKKNFSTAFRHSEDKIKILGYPRNDLLFRTPQRQDEKLVLYAPTLRRDNDNQVLDVFSSDEIKELENGLEDAGCHLYVKLHPKNKPKKSLRRIMASTKNITMMDEAIDLQEELYQFDILITDYSSLYFDYLLTDRPIIFAPFDIEGYLRDDRTFYYDYNEVTPGPKAKTWSEVLRWINTFLAEAGHYSEERKRIRGRFHKYQDDQSCERIYQAVGNGCI